MALVTKRLIKCLLFSFLFLFSVSVSATMIVLRKGVDAESIAKSASLIVKARWEAEIQKGFSTFVVKEVIRGEERPPAVGDKINVRHPGLNFSKKREYLLMLGKPNELGVKSIIGGYAGCYSVSKNAQGKKVVHGLVSLPSAVVGGAQKSEGKAVVPVANEAGYEEFVEFLKESNQ